MTINKILTGQLNSLFAGTCNLKRYGQRIKVQPTAISRRSTEVRRGSKRMQSGRPAKKRPSLQLIHPLIFFKFFSYAS